MNDYLRPPSPGAHQRPTPPPGDPAAASRSSSRQPPGTDPPPQQPYSGTPGAPYLLLPQCAAVSTQFASTRTPAQWKARPRYSDTCQGCEPRGQGSGALRLRDARAACGAAGERAVQGLRAEPGPEPGPAEPGERGPGSREVRPRRGRGREGAWLTARGVARAH